MIEKLYESEFHPKITRINKFFQFLVLIKLSSVYDVLEVEHSCPLLEASPSCAESGKWYSRILHLHWEHFWIQSFILVVLTLFDTMDVVPVGPFFRVS